MAFRLTFVFVLYSSHIVLNICANPELGRDIFNKQSTHPGSRKTIIINAGTGSNLEDDNDRYKREVPSTPVDAATDKVKVKINYLNDTHKQLMVHWVGEGSDVIICLARDPTPTVPNVLMNPSNVYISYNYGDTYENKTELFKLEDGSYSTVEKFYNHPKYNTHFVFTDVKNKQLFVTTNHGLNITRHSLVFTPSEISFHEYQPEIFLALNKDDGEQLWLTDDFGKSWRLLEEYVKSFTWLQDDKTGEQQLIIQRTETTGLSIILHSTDLYKTHHAQIFATDVKNFGIKGHYMFFTKKSSKDNYDLYVSYKLGSILKCIFDSELDRKDYYIVDVTGNRALVAVSHTDTLSHLYVSENLAGNDGKVHFTLSLEAVLCYFPNSTWQDSWLHHVSEEAFADVYKVEGLSGIYIASQVTVKPVGHNLGPQHLVSLITFDHGGSWRPITPPEYDNEGQLISCSAANNCSLHLSQRFSKLYPDTRSISILSSKSAPGIIIATGIIGQSLKGHFGMYISVDAGFTWRQALRELYFFNMGDHGGIFTAVKYFKNRGETRHILYSTDEGETWHQAAFHDEDLRLYELMTEPGENSTVFTMFGSKPQKHQWIIVKLDMRHVFEYNCSKQDYKSWSPSQSDENRSYVPCVLGKQLTYTRRVPHSNCYTGLDFDRPQSLESCDCDALDYECDFGFIRTGKPFHCIRNKTTIEDPYEIPSTCKPGQFYNRTKGYRKISGDECVGGFEKQYLPDIIPCPFKEVQGFLLFALRDRIGRFDLETQKLEDLPVHNLKNVIAIDFDMKNNCVYWADIVTDTIGRQCFNNGSAAEILVSTDLASIEGMAYDWISQHLYFVDGNRARIEMIKTSISHASRMRKTILDSRYLKKPRGVAVHPAAGYLFWTDWASDNASVSRSNLDGTNIKLLFSKPKVEWPNGITIDHIAERIYWVDAREDYIGSSDLHGGRFKKVIEHNNLVSHPFAIAVFKDSMFWDDWKENAVFRADKDHGVAVKLLLNQLPGLMDLKVYAHSIQEGSNACLNASCSYFCVGAPKQSYTCLCPDGMEMINNECFCPGKIRPFRNMTCPSIANTCSKDHHICNNGICIANSWKCDGEDDCGDGSDEAHCITQTCAPNYFLCKDNGKCLPHYWRCDYERDCADGSDELNCPKQNCTENQFTCNNGRCISKRWKCDGENDCRDGSDEKHCISPEPVTCKSDEFQCAGGGVNCISAAWRCDLEHDCKDGSDELNCSNNTCADYQFPCGAPTFKCIYPSWVCDGDKDCPDGIDEKNCTTVVNTTPLPENPFLPTNGTSCHNWMFMCANKKCIPFWWKCDMADDCGDNSDEIGCGPFAVTTNKPVQTSQYPNTLCNHTEFQCAFGNCIPLSWVCDGSKDCLKGEDEMQCSGARHCTDEEFKCRMDGTCIPLKDVCNDHVDCPDGSDESSCSDEKNVPSSGSAGPSCSIGYFPCDGSVCHPLALLCDGKHDCRDNFDETKCNPGKRVYQVLHMGVDDRTINQTSLLLYWWIQIPDKVKMEFLPSISKFGSNKFENKTWTDQSEYRFGDLLPFTKYNMTVYVRLVDTKTVFPPARYFISTTAEGTPSQPWNLTLEQKNGSHILISWNKPVRPNGIIQNYEICWFPPQPPIKLKLSDNSTAHLLTVDFQPEEKYSFFVIAHSKLYASKRSEIKSLVFDGESNLDGVKNLTVTDRTDRTVSLAWEYKDKSIEGFSVNAEVIFPYPQLPKFITSNNKITVENLAPGVYYTFKVTPFKKSYRGPKSAISVMTTGTPLPIIDTLKVDFNKEVGTAVNLTWQKPKDNRKLDWEYGVYYGLNEENTLEKPRLTTSDTEVTITNLEACELYIFSVGIVGPYGIGNVSINSPTVMTSLNSKAPPKRLTVIEDPFDHLAMMIQWSSSCPTMTEPVGYIVTITEATTKKMVSHSISNTTNSELNHKVTITYGGIYEVKVSTDRQGAISTSPVTYIAPPLLPPREVKVFAEYNGSYILYWAEEDIPPEVGTYKYEIFVSEGDTLNKKTAQKFESIKPPFIFNNATMNSYTFGVQLVTTSGYRSLVAVVSAGPIIFQESRSDVVGGSSSITAILIPAGLLLVILGGALAFLIVRHRRLQNSFTRFANSHYDTRSGAATFDDNSLEEEESPQIRGFSDDEPLVIA